MQSSLSAEECIQIEKLRTLVKHNLSSYYDTDFNILRWLQGHPGSVEEVAEKLNDHLKARRSSWKLDSFLNVPRNHPIHNHWKYGITGPSGVLDNVIVNIEQCGQMDYWGMLQTHSITEVLRARIYDLEDMLRRVMEVEKETGRQASILYVMDLTGLKYNKRLYHLVVGPLRSLAEFMAVHYVELFKYFVLVNVPSFVYALWTAVRPLLPFRTREKVRILSSLNWRQEILEYANAESLPDKWNPPMENIFTSKVEIPILFDENNYCNKNFKMPKGVTELRVAAGKFCYLVRELEIGERLSWWIMGNADFGFGVFFTEDRNESDHTIMEAIYPCFGWMPGPLIVPVEDSILAEKKGFYKILFTNTRAWWHTLNVMVAVDISTT